MYENKTPKLEILGYSILGGGSLVGLISICAGGFLMITDPGIQNRVENIYRPVVTNGALYIAKREDDRKLRDWYDKAEKVTLGGGPILIFSSMLTGLSLVGYSHRRNSRRQTVASDPSSH